MPGTQERESRSWNETMWCGQYVKKAERKCRGEGRKMERGRGRERERENGNVTWSKLNDT